MKCLPVILPFFQDFNPAQSKSPSWPYWKLWNIRQTDTQEIIIFSPLCETCYLFYLAQTEAEKELRKYCRVWVERCICGRAMIELKSGERCIPCWREARMFSSIQRKIDLAFRAAKELKRKANEHE